MQTEYIEKWNEFCKYAAKPLKEITELNINTLNELTKNTKLDEFTQAKKPEEFLAAQTTLVNESIKSIGNYTQKACEIWQDAATQSSKIINDIFHQATCKSSDNLKSSHKDKSKE